MALYRDFLDPVVFRKEVLIPSVLDLGLVKTDDLHFDLNLEVAGLRAADALPTKP